MAVVTVKSGAITNRDASPQVRNSNFTQGAALKEFVGTLEATSGDSIASIYKFGSIPSNARMSELLLSCDDLGTTTVADFGLYRSTKDGAAVVDADFFGSAVSLKDGALANSNILNESGVIDIAEMEQAVWQLLGLSSDPGVMYDVCATLTAACDGSGTITLRGKYV